MTDLTTTSDQKKTDTSKGKANGKIFISPDPYEEPSKDSFLSLGHRIFERLNENADLIIYVSILLFLMDFLNMRSSIITQMMKPYSVMYHLSDS